MQTTFPGTTIEVIRLEKGSSKLLFDGIFATGGITLSQVSVMTGLEPYLIQNWVKRGFVSSPVKRTYSREQFARIVIINMLRESLKIERICNLIHVIGGRAGDAGDDLISDDELYHRYVDMLAESGFSPLEPESVTLAAQSAAADFDEPVAGARRQLVAILQIMLYAHTASRLKDRANELVFLLE